MRRRVPPFLLAVAGALASAGCAPSQGPAAPASGPPAAPAPASASPAGTRVQGEAFLVALETPASARPGEPATARVVVASRGAYHVNRDYPMAFRPGPESTVRFAGERVPLVEGAVRAPCRDFPGEACEVTSPLAFTAPVAGEARLSGTVAFSVCNPDRCLIEKVPLSSTVGSR